jgi:hypothetical protein
MISQCNVYCTSTASLCAHQGNPSALDISRSVRGRGGNWQIHCLCIRPARRLGWLGVDISNLCCSRCQPEAAEVSRLYAFLCHRKDVTISTARLRWSVQSSLVDTRTIGNPSGKSPLPPPSFAAARRGTGPMAARNQERCWILD